MRKYEVRSLANENSDICVQYLPSKTCDSIILKDKAVVPLHQSFFAWEYSDQKPLIVAEI